MKKTVNESRMELDATCWEKICCELNKIGPAIKDAAGWRSVNNLMSYFIVFNPRFLLFHFRPIILNNTEKYLKVSTLL